MSAENNHKIDQLQEREAQAKAMGSPRRLAAITADAKLNARQRIESLLDPTTFQERGLLAHSDLPDAKDKTPADGKITGFGEIDGRTVFVSADDVSVMAGAGGRIGTTKQFEWSRYATDKGYPCIHLGDAGGARVPDIMGSYGMMSMTYPILGEPRNRRVPQITTIMGECYGGPGWTAAVSDIIIQVKGSIMAVGGPAILSIATGEQATPEALGGWEQHAYHTGQVDLFAEDDVECLWLARKVLSYLPASTTDLPPIVPTHIPANQELPDLLDIVPSDPKAAYDMHHVIDRLADPGTVLELKPFYDGSLITALARMDGHSVGILANNPMVTAGAMGPGACEKAASFIALCDSFHIPLVFLHDTPGFLLGQAAEDRKMQLKIMTYIEALNQCTVPRVSCVIRKSYGMAHCNMSGGSMGSDLLLAWPSSQISFVAPDVAVSIVYGRKLAKVTDPQERQKIYQTMIAELERGNEPWDAAGANLIDKVIDPRHTRTELIHALAHARGSHGNGGRSQRRLANWPRMF